MQAEEIDQKKEKSIVLGGGCFWCVEAVFDGAKGVKNVVSGYSGGQIKTHHTKK